jgi:hypothetical protein
MGARAKGLCSLHYSRLKNTGSVGPAKSTRRGPRPCKVDGCDNIAVTRNDLCPTHRRRKRLYGNEDGSFSTHKQCVECGEQAVSGPKSSDHCADHYEALVRRLVVQGDPTITLSNGNGYRYVSIFKRSIPVHRIVMEYMLGRPLAKGENVHHINGVRDDNSPENLELWVKPQPTGQRVADLVDWVVTAYPDMVRERMSR